ncbi:multicopper oxidase domain-containing protein [candidate division KSB1 bacterium]|nr:multicopper oxidase domain-containing protein [candidate division KSB1 bacterium]NIR69049.1 multicopper oxidase domain-containing protein [candidate division KSB1 bacterium]NIS25617.1 multicopper oxidase domain-containing protein [candidate division KSB1 bacterium]NIT73967.1 multicopper oxidase domain-containing protein [candidate division KSB1 bacterium]NIU26294.1 multicopper oxidase domain-containing protein [candidate division KSB1 bacterium]
MKRREFLATSAALTAAGLLPGTLLSEAVKQENEKKFPKPLEFQMVGDTKEFELFIDIAQQEPVPEFEFHTLSFNNQIPGPEIRVNRGDKVRVKFKNKTELNHTIHWHGLHVPWRMDGVPYVTQMPVMSQQEFVYEFVAEPYGTHFYHCHWGTLLHMQSGMFGSIIIEEPKDDPIKKKFPYEREYTLIYSAHDTNFIRGELNYMLDRMKERMYLMKNGRFDKERFATFDTKEQFLEAIKNGYSPPYTINRRAPSELPQPQWFTVNGKSYPMTPTLYINEGENIRVRLINAGQLEHSLHLHGHDFWLVCDDGLPVPQPWQQNTARLSPGKTLDIIIEGKNRGIWTFHDHDTSRVTNNGLYPGGTLMALVYEDMPPEEAELDMMAKKMGLKSLPIVALDE